jgi:hypothetical protein
VPPAFFTIGLWICNVGIFAQLTFLAIAVTRGSESADLQMLVGVVLGIANIATGAAGLMVLRSAVERRAARVSAPRYGWCLVYGAILAELILVAVVDVYSPIGISVPAAAADLGERNLSELGDRRSRVALAWPYAQYANLGDVFGFRSATAYDPLLLKRTASLLRAGQRVVDPWGDATNNVLLDEDGGAAFDVLGVGSFVAPLDDGARVWMRDSPLPRLSLIERARLVATPRESLSAVVGPGFDPRAEVVLEDAAAELSPSDAGIAREIVEVVREAPGVLEARISAPRGGYLLFSESYYPGWQAESGSQVAPMVPADHAIMAVRLAPGNYPLVRLRFTTPWLWPSVGLACLAAAAIAALGIRCGR